MSQETDRTEFGKRLQAAIDHAGRTQSWLAERAGVKQQSVQYLCQKGKASRYTGEFARLLGVRQAWLAHGDGAMLPDESENKAIKQDLLQHYIRTWGTGLGTQKFEEEIRGRYRDEIREQSASYGPNTEQAPDLISKLPLISWVQAGAFQNISDPYQPGDAENWVPVTKRYSKRAFCLRVRGDSMQASEGFSFPDGAIICVEPDAAANNKSFVVVRLEDTEEATFKQLVVDGSKRYLKPLNPRYPIIEISSEATICGVVRQMIMDF